MNELERKVPVPAPLALTMGDPAGIGPEIIVKAWLQLNSDNQRCVVYGLASSLRLACQQTQQPLDIQTISDPQQVTEFDLAKTVPVIEPHDLASSYAIGQVSAEAGHAAVQFIDLAIAATIAGQTSGVVTAPINKASLKAAGCKFPGHTEILADRCGVSEFAMMLNIPASLRIGGDIGVGVVHTTLHQSLRSAIDNVTIENILSKCRLAEDFARRSLDSKGLDRDPRIAVAALNPHGGEQGILGDEEISIIAPAVQQAQAMGLHCVGPLPCDTLISRAVDGEFDLVVAMYHDQGHIPLKLLGMHNAVNVTLGLPIIRTSVAHGTAFEIAGSGQADCASLVLAASVARQMMTAKISD